LLTGEDVEFMNIVASVRGPAQKGEQNWNNGLITNKEEN